MFPQARTVLKALEGTLEQVPFALLLHAISKEERTCTLELKRRNLEKHLFFEDGELVGCESNLLHETLGKYLVEKGKLSESQHHTLLSQSIAAERTLASVLVEQQLLSPFELFKHLQANLAHRILDTFRWSDATWRLNAASEVETPIRLNCARLIFMGANVMADEAIARHFPLPPMQHLAITENGAEARNALKLAGRELKLWQAIKARPTLGELLSTAGFTSGEVMRRLFAWCILEMVDLAELVVAQPRPTPPPPSSASSVTSLGLPFLDEDEVSLNALATQSLTFRAKDPFDLLGVPVTVEAPALQKAFLARADKFPPSRFRSSELRGKAEHLLLAYARALGSLSEPEARALHLKRREALAHNKKQGGPNPQAAAAHFRIRTELLDADSQFNEGLKRFEEGSLKEAAELFEYACDIDPKGRFRAYLALALYRLNPDSHWQKSLAELADICAAEPTCEHAWAFRGDLALAYERKSEAKEAFGKALALNPKNVRYAKAFNALRSSS